MKSTNLNQTIKILFVLIVLCFTLSSCIKTTDIFDIEDMEEWEIFNRSSGLANNYVMCITEDNGGNIWVGTYGGGISKYSGDFWNTYSTSSGHLINDTVISIFQDNSGAIWFGTNAGLSYFKNNQWFYFPYFNGVQISAFCQTSAGDVLIGTQGYGFFYGEGDGFVRISDTECGYCDYINTMYKDNSGNIWFGTYGGLKKYTGNNWSNYTLYTTDNGLATNDIYPITEDSRGNMWIGGFGGEKVVKYSNGKFEQISLYNDMPTYILSIEEDTEGNIWFGGIEVGAVKYDGTIMRSYFETDGLPDNTVTAILSDKNGDLWFGTSDNGIGRYKSYLSK